MNENEYDEDRMYYEGLGEELPLSQPKSIGLPKVVEQAKKVSKDLLHWIDNGYKITQLSNNNLNQFKYKFIKDENYLNNLNNLIIYGSVNFYKSNVELDNVFFSNISSEDSINIFKSKFKLKDIKFNNVGSDAVDIDFSNGEISNINFINISNDALDFSGSKVNIENIKFENVGDKAISAGEYSDLTIRGLMGENSFIGIANKDGLVIPLT